MAKCSRSPSDETAPSRGAKDKRAGVATKPTPSALAISSSWAVKRARGARHRRHVAIPRRRWDNLTYALAGVIAEHALANDMSDYMSFRAVCREWRRGAVDAAPRPRGCLDRRFHPRRWIMLREAAPPGPARHRRRFLNVSTGECVQKDLPELDGHHLLGATPEGLLALLDESTYVVRMLNPTTRQLAELPSLDPFLSVDMRNLIFRHEFTVPGIGLADDSTSTVAFCLHSPHTVLLVARPGDDCWTVLNVDGRHRFHAAMSFSGRFYCVTHRAVMVLEVAAADEPPRLEEVAGITFRVSEFCMDTVLHLLESDGKLLLLCRWREPSRANRYLRTTTKYQVYRVDLDESRVVPVHGLRDRAVFVGCRRAVSVSTGAFPSIRSNSIYLGYDLSERTYGGVVAYNLHGTKISERCSRRDDRRAWARPCGIAEYLSWYISDPSGSKEEEI